MTEVLLFHHAQGVTPGIRAFADQLRAAGHTVHVPDLFDGRTFDSIDEGMAFINSEGFDALRERGVRTADDLPAELVYAGFSFGETIAQQLAQTRPGARGALLFYSCIPHQRRVGVRAVAGRRAGPDPRRRPRSDLRRRRRHRCGPGDRRDGPRRRAVPLSERPALLRRQFPPLLRPGGRPRS